MKRFRLAAAAALLALLGSTPVSAGTKAITASGYALPANKPVTIVLMRPDTDVGLLAAGGLPQPKADWTEAARVNLTTALAQSADARGLTVRLLPDQRGETGKLVADYEALHRAVVRAIVEHKYYGDRLPTKKDRFDWTLGPGTQALGTLSGGNYGLFLYTRDNFASDARKAMQVVGAVGLIFGLGGIVTGGTHVAYASLVELETGNVVWFNILRGSKGDVRTPEGARAMVDAILKSMPTRPGESGDGK